MLLLVNVMFPSELCQ